MGGYSQSAMILVEKWNKDANEYDATNKINPTIISSSSLCALNDRNCGFLFFFLESKQWENDEIHEKTNESNR
jgi:hypothetical protein